jgi:hypothetical protein
MKTFGSFVSTLAILLAVLFMVVIAYTVDNPVYFYIIILVVLIPSVMFYYSRFGRRR